MPQFVPHIPRRRATVLAAAALALIVPAQASAQVTCDTQGSVGTAYAPGVNCRTVELDGHPRRFVVYVPQTAAPAARRPVVFMFHGSSGTGEEFLNSSGWREVADETGLVAVFPTGLRYRVLETGRLTTKWNDFNLAEQIDTTELPPGSDAGAPVPADDVGFVDTMVADLRAGLPIDGRRVYAAGFSNGAGFAARLSVDRSDQLAAAAYSGGGGVLEDAAPARPVPTLISLGTDDPKIIEHVDPSLPALPLDPVQILSTPGLTDFFGRYHAAFGLDPALYGAIADADSTTVRWPATGLGPNGALLKFVMLAGLRHRYPDGAAAEGWRFLREHRAPA